MSDEILTENQTNQTTNNQDANKPPVDASSGDKTMVEKVEVMVEEAFGAVGEVFEAMKDEVVEHLGDAHADAKDAEPQDATTPQAASEHGNADVTTAHEGEANMASGDVEPAPAAQAPDAEHSGDSTTDAAANTTTPVANFAPAHDAVDSNASNVEPTTTTATATATTEPAAAHTAEPVATAPAAAHAEQPATPATGHQDGHQTDGHEAVVVEVVVVQETIVHDADGTEHVQIVEAHEVATVVEGENGEVEVYAVEEYAVVGDEVLDGEAYDASDAEIADYDATADEVADYDATPDHDTTDHVDTTADHTDYQDTHDTHDAVDTQMSDHVSYD